jgi:hypothetical protein
MWLQTQRGFLEQVTGGDQLSDQIDLEVDGAAMARVLNLANVLEMVVAGLDDHALA